MRTRTLRGRVATGFDQGALGEDNLYAANMTRDKHQHSVLAAVHKSPVRSDALKFLR